MHVATIALSRLGSYQEVQSSFLDDKQCGIVSSGAAKAPPSSMPGGFDAQC